MINEPPHDKTNKMVCAPSKDSDQPGHPPSLRPKKVNVLFPETSQYFLGSVGMEHFCGGIFFI